MVAPGYAVNISNTSDLTTFRKCQSVALNCEVDLRRRTTASMCTHVFTCIDPIVTLVPTPIIRYSHYIFYLFSHRSIYRYSTHAILVPLFYSTLLSFISFSIPTDLTVRNIPLVHSLCSWSSALRVHVYNP